MASNLIRSGWATLEYEIAEERASALGRLGRRLEAALAALAACPPERKNRDGLIEEAGYALWLFIAQREACGLNDSTHVMQTYGVPGEVCARMGPSAMTSIHLTKTEGGRQETSSRDAGPAYGAIEAPRGTD